jgi:hypothetical protein
MQTQKYLYKACGRTYAFIGVISIIACLLAAGGAMNNQRGLIINHILEFSAAGATRLYWSIALFFAAALVWLLWTVLTDAYKDQYILVTDHTISVPIHFSQRDPVVVRLTSIREISTLIQQRTNYRTLRIHHRHGHLDILEGVLNSAPLFERLKRALIERVEAAEKLAVAPAP